MEVIGKTDDSYQGSELKRVYYTMDLGDDKFIDVMVSEPGICIYVMEVGDGSLVYDGKSEQTYPEFEFDEDEAIRLANEAFSKDYGKIPMTESRMEEILGNDVYFDQLEKDGGIFEFFSLGDLSIGISYESEGPDGEAMDRYIYNLFYQDEYINVPGYGTKEDQIPDAVIKELVEKWNDVLEHSKLMETGSLEERIQAAGREKEKVLKKERQSDKELCK